MTPSTPSWSQDTTDLAGQLHHQLRIGDRDWHRLKTDRKRRAAELLSAALVNLIQDGSMDESQALAHQAIGWLQGELKDPGCPHRSSG
ncbi:DUF6439 family protein [Parasynechococcus sp.]|jgi:hypothetical protein|uniref:DUF6439 family protein n=1 Tax=Parasynechococcus sp. TaxID=3101203 RepID=UPI0037049FBC